MPGRRFGIFRTAHLVWSRSGRARRNQARHRFSAPGYRHPAKSAGLRELRSIDEGVSFRPHRGPARIQASTFSRPARIPCLNVDEAKSMSDQNAEAELDAPYRPLGNAVQIAYVTNDIDRAREMFRTVYGVERWLDLAGMSGRQTVSINARNGRIEIRGMIAYVGAIQFELIQPIVDPERLYTDFLPADGTFAVRF